MMPGVLIAIGLVVLANLAGLVGWLATGDIRNWDRFTCYAYAGIVGVLVSRIW